MEFDTTLLDRFTEWCITFLPKLGIAIAIIFIGFWLIKKIIKVIEVAIVKANLGKGITDFLLSLVDMVLKFIVILMAAGMLGFQISTLIGVLAAAGFAIALALQGFMGNFASGMTIVFFKPYKIGDWVEVCDKFGKVTSIQIFNTTMITPGKKTLIIPNGQITDNVITNFSTEGHIRLKLEVTMPYAESFPKVKKIIEDALNDVPNILIDPPTEIGILSYDSHSIILTVRPFVKPEHFWSVTYDVHARIKEAFNSQNIKVAYSEGVELGDIGN